MDKCNRGSKLLKLALNINANEPSVSERKENINIVNNASNRISEWINNVNFEKNSINNENEKVSLSNVYEFIESPTTSMSESGEENDRDKVLDNSDFIKNDNELITSTILQKKQNNTNTNSLLINKESDLNKIQTLNKYIIEPIVSVDKDININDNLAPDEDQATRSIYTELLPLETQNEHNNEISDSASYITDSVVDDENDKDFNIFNYIDQPDDNSCESNNFAATENSISTTIESQQLLITPLSEKLKKQQSSKNKVVRCQYCKNDIANKNFMRHLERNHENEDEVRNILQLPKNSKERRQATLLLRNNTNFDLFISDNIIRPHYNHTKKQDENDSYYPCAYCKGMYKKQYLKRHAKSCLLQKKHSIDENERKNHIALSQTTTACAMDPTNVVSKLNVKKQVFDLMKGDDIAFEAKKDLLITLFGESYLKKHRRERMAYACSNRMRELSRLLICYRKIINDNNVTLKETIYPKNFENVVKAVREIAGYEHTTKTFKAPSLALHLGTSLKSICDELTHLILKENIGFKCKTKSETKAWLHDVKNFKKLIDSRWNIELASLANKDLMEKRWQKPLLLPLVSDIKKFREETIALAEENRELLLSGNLNEKSYKILSQCTLALLIIFNRRRIGDVQYLKIKDYKNDKKSNYKDFEHVLTETEKILTQKYKRVINSGKGSRAVVVLIPELLEKYIDVLLEHRENYIKDNDNEYVFSLPGSKIKWGKGDVAIRTLCKKFTLENPQAISSNKLRKQIATITQILSLSQSDIKQFSNFMGHTQKTHDEFYELPVDIYQTAKVSKLLLMMEKGNVPVEYSGKSLAEIDLDPQSLYAEIEDKANENDDATELGKIINNEETCTSSNKCSVLENNDKQLHEQISDESDASNKSECIPKKKCKRDLRKRTQKNPWSNKDIETLKKHFGSYIKQKKYPTGTEIKEFLHQTKMERTVPVIKSKIQHLMN